MSEAGKPVRQVGPVRPSSALSRRELFRSAVRWSGVAALLGLVGWRGLRSAARRCDSTQFPSYSLCAGCWIVDSCNSAMVPRRASNQEAKSS